MKDHLKPAREMILSPGDPGQVWQTKVSGVPWWPAKEPRPECTRGHELTFMLQCRMTDVPGWTNDRLLSFHYCLPCSYEGNRSWGWWDDRDFIRYDVRLLDPGIPDGLGTVAEVVIEPHEVALLDLIEVPAIEDTPFEYNQGPRGWIDALEVDLGQFEMPGARHCATSKLGGWPSWQQPPEWPHQEKSRWEHIFQIDMGLGENAPWGGGGYAHVFLPSDRQGERGELTVQTT